MKKLFFSPNVAFLLILALILPPSYAPSRVSLSNHRPELSRRALRPSNAGMEESKVRGQLETALNPPDDGPTELTTGLEENGKSASWPLFNTGAVGAIAGGLLGTGSATLVPGLSPWEIGITVLLSMALGTSAAYAIRAGWFRPRISRGVDRLLREGEKTRPGLRNQFFALREAIRPRVHLADPNNRVAQKLHPDLVDWITYWVQWYELALPLGLLQQVMFQVEHQSRGESSAWHQSMIEGGVGVIGIAVSEEDKHLAKATQARMKSLERQIARLSEASSENAQAQPDEQRQMLQDVKEHLRKLQIMAQSLGRRRNYGQWVDVALATEAFHSVERWAQVAAGMPTLFRESDSAQESSSRLNLDRKHHIQSEAGDHLSNLITRAWSPEYMFLVGEDLSEGGKDHHTNNHALATLISRAAFEKVEEWVRNGKIPDSFRDRLLFRMVQLNSLINATVEYGKEEGVGEEVYRGVMKRARAPNILTEFWLEDRADVMPLARFARSIQNLKSPADLYDRLHAQIGRLTENAAVRRWLSSLSKEQQALKAAGVEEGVRTLAIAGDPTQTGHLEDFLQERHPHLKIIRVGVTYYDAIKIGQESADAVVLVSSSSNDTSLETIRQKFESLLFSLPRDLPIAVLLHYNSLPEAARHVFDETGRNVVVVEAGFPGYIPVHETSAEKVTQSIGRVLAQLNEAVGRRVAGVEENPINNSLKIYGQPLGGPKWLKPADLRFPESGGKRPISDEVLFKAIGRLPNVLRDHYISDSSGPGLAYYRYVVSPSSVLPGGQGFNTAQYLSFEVREKSTGRSFVISEIQLPDIPPGSSLSLGDLWDMHFLLSEYFRMMKKVGIPVDKDIGPIVGRFSDSETAIRRKRESLPFVIFWEMVILHEVGGILWSSLLSAGLKDRWQQIYPFKNNPEEGPIYLRSRLSASAHASQKKNPEKEFYDDAFSDKFSVFILEQTIPALAEAGWVLRPEERTYFNDVIAYFEDKVARGFKVHEIEPAPAAGVEETSTASVEVVEGMARMNDFLGQVGSDPSVLFDAGVHDLAESFGESPAIEAFAREGVRPLLLVLPDRLSLPGASLDSPALKLLVDPKYDRALREQLSFALAFGIVEITVDPSKARFVIGDRDFVQIQKGNRLASREATFLQVDPSTISSLTQDFLTLVAAYRPGAVLVVGTQTERSDAVVLFESA